MSQANAATETLAAAPPIDDVEGAALAAPIITETAGALARSVQRDIPLGALVPSPLNPRREFDKAAIEELADSIHANGLLQPLLVRESSQLAIGFRLDGKTITPHELICGERRLRALAFNVDRGLASWSDTVPCRVRACSDSELVVLAATENLARRDMHPLDETAVFDALRKALLAEADGRPKGRAEEEIAKRLGIAPRTVFRRLRLTRLAPELQVAMRKGEINNAQAEAFALGAHNDQRTYFKAMKRDHWRCTPDRIKDTMANSRVLAKAALFALDLYDGERLVDPDDESTVYLTDVAQFTKLQRVAIDAKKATLEKKHAFVVEVQKGANHSYQFAGGSTTKSGVVVSVSKDLAYVNFQAGYITAEMARAAAAARNKKAKGKAAETETAPKRPLTRAQAVAIKHAKTLAMRRGLAKRPEVALAAAITAVLNAEHGYGSSTEIRLRIGRNMNFRPVDEPPGTDEDEGRQVKLLEPIADVLFAANKAAEREGEWSDADQVAVFQALCAQPIGILLAMFAEFMGAGIGTWPGYQEDAHDSPTAIAIAAAVDADSELPAVWAPDEAYFGAYGGDALHALALSAGLAHEGFNKLKKGERVALLADQKPEFWQPWRFPELRFQDDKTLRAALAGVYPSAPPKPGERPTPAPAKAKPAPKKRNGK